MGLTTSSIKIQENNVLSDEEDALVALALSHSCCTEDKTVEDPYFTLEQWEVHVKRLETAFKEVVKKNKTEVMVMNDDHLQGRADELEKYYCKCKAHSCEEDWIWDLLDISEPINDGDGV